MTRLSRLYAHVLAIVAGACMALVFGVIFVNSLRRYVSGQSLPWGDELPVYVTIYGVMSGVALACLQDRHIRFAVLLDALSDHARGRLLLAMDAVTCIVGVALAWSGLVFVSRRPQVEASGLIGSAQDLAAATGIEALVWLGRMGTWQFAIVYGGVALALAAALRLSTRAKEI
ncbi:TRAP transporter small permease [Citreimonas salinaria]|uniref:TRAP transporter small permease protein n=1 Tax=Citreimonas salinaria TaxID=321339 RepID=A0A1H3H5X9_9RHOB|nr:TRAP transporter small permease subunit [Citreimonas salinaria]SDY10144.1 Tripartite ATP-independent transporter, DctQ component [Citreimonas salinaria]